MGCNQTTLRGNLPNLDHALVALNAPGMALATDF